MKKIKVFLIAVALFLCCITANTKAEIDLVEEKQLLCKALWAAEAWEEVVLPIGTYEIGVDIPAGDWILWAYDYASSDVLYGASLRPGNAAMHFTKDVEKDVSVDSKKLVWFDERLDDEYAAMSMENGYFICVKYGKVLMRRGPKADIEDFLLKVPDDMLKMGADAIRERIREIDAQIREKQECQLLNAGIWEIGKDIPTGLYEIRPQKGASTHIQYGEKADESGERLDRSYIMATHLDDIQSSEYDSPSSDTVEYWNLETGMLFAVRTDEGPAELWPYAGKEPLTFLNASDAMGKDVEWNEKSKEEEAWEAWETFFEIMKEKNL